MSIVVCTKCGTRIGINPRTPNDGVEYRGWCKDCEAKVEAARRENAGQKTKPTSN